MMATRATRLALAQIGRNPFGFVLPVNASCDLFFDADMALSARVGDIRSMKSRPPVGGVIDTVGAVTIGTDRRDQET